MSDDVPQETYPAEPTPPTPAPSSDPGVIPVEDDDTFDTDDENKG